MDINIVIMSANNEIAIQNTEGQRNTFIKGLFETERRHNYKVFFYSGGAEKKTEECKLAENIYEIKCISKDDVYHTFEKTCEAYDYILNHYHSDMTVRANISCYINIDLLDYIIQDIYDSEYIIANRINTIITIGNFMNKLYPRGDFYILKTSMIEKSLQYKDSIFEMHNLEIDSVDDTKFGMCLAKGVDSYVDKLHCCKYGFVPFSDFSSVNANVLDVRVKTCNPEAGASGYSWNDNDFRVHDIEKMNVLHKAFSGITSKFYMENKYTLNDILIDDSEVKRCLYVSPMYMTLDQIKNAQK